MRRNHDSDTPYGGPLGPPGDRDSSTTQHKKTANIANSAKRPQNIIYRSPGGPRAPPYGVSSSWFLFIHLAIVLLLLSSSNFSYHVLLLLSRLAFVAPVAPLGVSLIDPLGAQGAPYGVSLSCSFPFILSSSCFSCHRLISLITSCLSYHVLHSWPQ